MRVFLAVLFALALAACAGGTADKNLDEVLAAEAVEPATAALLIVRLEDGQRWSSGGARLSERFIPASTSKIPHTLIALETGAVSGPDEMFEWDGQKRFVENWNKDQTFAYAFNKSTVWIYQEVTPRIGADALSEWLAKFDYGNADIGQPENISQYWLTGPLAISAEEQVGFLTRLARRDLPLSESTYDSAIPIMVEARGEDWLRYAKTGWKSVEGETDLGWYVGWLEQTGGDAPGTYVFAFNMDMEMPAEDRNKRRKTVHSALRSLGLMAAPE